MADELMTAKVLCFRCQHGVEDHVSQGKCLDSGCKCRMSPKDIYQQKYEVAKAALDRITEERNTLNMERLSLAATCNALRAQLATAQEDTRRLDWVLAQRWCRANRDDIDAAMTQETPDNG